MFYFVGWRTLSKIGDMMICSIWSGTQRGIYIGNPKRRQHFSKENNDIVIEIEGEDCFTSLSPSFWRSCPEIRVARSKTGFNTLHHWIGRHNLLPPGESIEKKGSKDTVMLTVIEPYWKYRLTL